MALYLIKVHCEVHCISWALKGPFSSPFWLLLVLVGWAAQQSLWVAVILVMCLFAASVVANWAQQRNNMVRLTCGGWDGEEGFSTWGEAIASWRHLCKCWWPNMSLELCLSCHSTWSLGPPALPMFSPFILLVLSQNKYNKGLFLTRFTVFFSLFVLDLFWMYLKP